MLCTSANDEQDLNENKFTMDKLIKVTTKRRGICIIHLLLFLGSLRLTCSSSESRRVVPWCEPAGARLLLLGRVSWAEERTEGAMARARRLLVELRDGEGQTAADVDARCSESSSGVLQRGTV